MNGKRLRAAQMLVVANAFWGLSFPVMKAMQLVHQPLLPAGSSWFVASSTIFVRFVLASLIMLLLSARTLHQLTRLEPDFLDVTGYARAHLDLLHRLGSPGELVPLDDFPLFNRGNSHGGR